MSKANKANKPDWVAKSMDVDPAQWVMVRSAAAVLDIDIRDWLRDAIHAALVKQRVRTGRAVTGILLCVAIAATSACSRKREVTVGPYTGDRTTWVDGRPVKYEVKR